MGVRDTLSSLMSTRFKAGLKCLIYPKNPYEPDKKSHFSSLYPLTLNKEIHIETMGLIDENVEKVIVLFLFLIDYNNVGCLEMLGVGGPDWVHRYF